MYESSHNGSFPSRFVTKSMHISEIYIRKSIPISLYRKCLRSSSVFSSLTSYKPVNIRLFFMDRHWRSRIEFCRVFICPWQLHWLLKLSWFANASSWSETFAISDLFFSQYGFILSNFFPTFVTSVLFLSQSDFKLSNKFPTPCTLFSTSVIFVWQFIMVFFNWNYATA